MDLTAHARTFEAAAATYDAVGVDFFAPIGRRLVDAVDLQPGQHVLDVGTGRGAVLAPAARLVGPGGRAVGIDLAPTMVALTAADLVDLPQVEVRQADAADLPDDLGRFDAVLASLVLFFADDPAASLQGWARRVRPGGRLGITTFLPDPTEDPWDGVVTRYLPGSEARASGAPTSFEMMRDPGRVDALLSAAGLVDVRAATFRQSVRVADVDHWERWAMSNGMRAPLEAIDPADRPALLADVAQVLDDHRLDDGSRGLVATVRLTTARRP